MLHIPQAEILAAQMPLPFPPSPLHPTQAELRQAFDYDPTSGALVNKAPRRGAKLGAEAGCAQVTRAGKKYRRVGFGRRQFYAHVLIMIFLGVFVPAHLEIDHIDGDGLNNRVENLRIVDHATNMKNRKAKA